MSEGAPLIPLSSLYLELDRLSKGLAALGQEWLDLAQVSDQRLANLALSFSRLCLEDAQKAASMRPLVPNLAQAVREGSDEQEPEFFASGEPTALLAALLSKTRRLARALKTSASGDPSRALQLRHIRLNLAFQALCYSKLRQNGS